MRANLYSYPVIAQKVRVIFHKEFSESSEEEKISNYLAVLAVLFVNKKEGINTFAHSL